MKPLKFIVRRFVNPTGFVSWRVDGQLHGVRIRRNFKSSEEGAAGKAALDIKGEQDLSGLRSITTALSIGQAREAEAIFRRLEGRTQTLTYYVDYALTNYRDAIHDRSIGEAAKEYLALRAIDRDQEHLSHRQFTSFRCELRALEGAFRGKTVSELTPAALTDFFRRGLASKKGYNDRRGLVVAFLKHCLLKDWIAAKGAV